MLFLEGYLKQVYITLSQAAAGGPAWAIRVTNGRGRTATFFARSWRLRAAGAVDLEGKGGPGDLLTPSGPLYWVETRMEIEADVPMPEAAIETLEPRSNGRRSSDQKCVGRPTNPSSVSANDRTR